MQPRESRRLRRIAAALLALASSPGWACISNEPVHFGAISTRHLEGSPRILAYDIGGADCPKGYFDSGDYGTAVEKAIQKVPGSNALLDARFYSKSFGWGKICVRVVGNAAVVE